MTLRFGNLPSFNVAPSHGCQRIFTYYIVGLHQNSKKLCNCLLSKYGSRNLTEKELNHDACQLQLECYYYFVHFYLKCLLLF